MADGLNSVHLLGNLGADPELRVTPNGQTVMRIRLATTESYLDAQRVRQERTEWHTITLWGKRAEALNRILAKGSRIFVDGSLRTSSYDDREGVKRTKTEINARNIILCGGRGNQRDSSGPSSDPGDDYPRGDSYSRGNDEPDSYGDDDIPF